MAKNKNYKPGDAEGNVQNPAAMMSLNYLLGSQGSQRNNGGVAPGAMYGGQPGQAGAAGPAPSYMQFPGSQPMPQGGGQQAAGRAMFSRTSPEVRKDQYGNRISADGKYASQMGGGQQKQPGQAMNRMAPMQGGVPQQPLQDYNQAQRTAFAPQTIPASDYGNTLGKNAPKTQPINSGIFDADAWAGQQRLAGKSVVGQTAGENYIQGQMMNDAMGGARDRFGAGMAPMMPGMLAQMGGSQAGFGMGGYGADGRPVGMQGSQVGQTMTNQQAMEAGGMMQNDAREQQASADTAAMGNKYTQELINNINSAASSNLANQLPEVAAQMEAAGLGRSGAGGLAASKMGQQVLSQANRDSMSVLAQQADQQAGRQFQGQQAGLERLTGAQNSSLDRMGNMGLGLTQEQGNRMQNEANMMNAAQKNNMNMFGLGEGATNTAMINAAAAEANARGIDQANWTGALNQGTLGFERLNTLATGLQQHTPQQQYQQQNPFVQMGGQVLGGAAQGLFSGGDSNIMGNR